MPRPVITALHVHFIDSTAVYRCVCVYVCVRALCMCVVCVVCVHARVRGVCVCVCTDT